MKMGVSCHAWTVDMSYQESIVHATTRRISTNQSKLREKTQIRFINSQSHVRNCSKRVLGRPQKIERGVEFAGVLGGSDRIARKANLVEVKQKEGLNYVQFFADFLKGSNGEV